MQVADLFPSNGSPKPAKSERPAFDTLECYSATLGDTHGGTWVYTDIQGGPVLGVVRIETGDAKRFQQLHPIAGGWAFKAPTGPLPLFNLPELANAERIVVLEGEQCCDAARTLGYIATTSAGGAQSPTKTDWTPLAGRDVVILPDNDAPGRAYAETVAKILTGLQPPARVKIVELPGLPDHGDIVDYIDARECVDTEDIKRAIDELIEAAPWFVPQADTPKPQAKRVRDALEWQPFPFDVFTEKIQRIILWASEAMGVDPAMLAIPLLAVFAGLIGNARRLVIKTSWSVPAILWTCIVADSGTGKSPAIEFASRSLYRLYRRAIREQSDAMASFNAKLSEWKKDHAEHKEDAQTTKPQEPILARVVIDDTTIECVAAIHAENPRGLALVRDELAGWFGGFDQYKTKGRGSDIANWEQLHNGGALIVDRKGSSGAPRQRLYVPRGAVSITGGVQLATLIRVLKPEHFESGLVARILVTMPPARLRQWSDIEVSQQDEADIDGIVDRLYELAPEYDRDGALSPKFLGMSGPAKAAYKQFFNEHCRELHDLRGDLKAAWSKREGYVGRCALVLHLTRWAAGEPGVNPDQLDETSLNNAIKLIRWFTNEDRRVYAALSGGSAGREDRELVALIENRGRRMSVHDIMRTSSRFGTTEEVETTLNRMAKAGAGRWEWDDHGGGRGAPKRLFVLGTDATNE